MGECPKGIPPLTQKKDIMDSYIEHIEESQKYFLVIYITKSCNLKCKYCIQSYKTSQKMSFETMQGILLKEIPKAESQNKKVYLRFMGGEPLTNFNLIKQTCEWIWSTYPSKDINISVRTNGTLLNEDMRQWFTKNAKKLSCGPSLDGIPEVNKINRGLSKDVKDFFMKNWPTYGAHGTLFPDSVQYLYDSVVYFQKMNYPFDIKIGLGTIWDDEHAQILEEQMNKLCNYYTEHLTFIPIAVFFKDLTHFGAEAVDPDFNCLDNHGGGVYDVDGTQYSCEVLMPLVHGFETAQHINSLDKIHRKFAINQECRNCPFLASCPTCPSMNLKYTGDFNKSATLVTTCKATKVQFKMSAYLTILRYEKYMQIGKAIPKEIEDNLFSSMEILNYVSSNG